MNEKDRRNAALDGLLGAGTDAGRFRVDGELARLREEPALDPARKQAVRDRILGRLDEPGAYRPLLPDAGLLRAANRARVLIRAAAAVVLLVLGGLWFLRDEPGLPGTIVSVTGDTRRGGVMLRGGETLGPGDELVAGAGAAVDFTVAGKNIFRLIGPARLGYELRANGGRLEIREGYLAAVVRNRPGLGALVLALGPVETRVTGTVLFVGSPEAGTGYVCLCHGRAVVADEREARAWSAAHHRAGLFRRNSAGAVEESPGDMRLHDDRMLEELAREIGETIDWSRAP